MKKLLNTTADFTIGDLRSHKRLCRAVAGVSSLLMLTTMTFPALAAGTAVLGGDAVLTGATGANLAQNTDVYAQIVSSGGASAVLDWTKFNVGAGKEMNFSGAGTTFFNLVNGAASKSQIDGLISGNGSVWVINPSGVAFGANAQVDVGGLFAAAAGNISNADAIRDGTATLPVFSSFDGSVSSASGAKFTADQVALMGKTVSAAGDYTGAKALTVGASSGAMTVDDVGGGKVSVNLGDFAVTDAEVALGDLDVGGSLSVTAVGKLKVNDAVEASGAVSATAQKDIDISADVTAAGGAVTVISKKGNVAIQKDATVMSEAEGGGINIAAASEDYSFANGSVKVDGAVKAGPGGDVAIYAGYGVFTTGDVEIDGSVEGEQVFVGAGAYFANPYGYYDVYGSYGTGNVSVKGTVSGGSRIMLATSGGDVVVGEQSPAQGVKASITAKNAGAEIDLDSAIASDYGYGTDSGNVTVHANATVAAEGADSAILIAGGYGYGANGNVSIAGDVHAAGDIHVYAGLTGTGDASVGTGGSVSGNRVFLASGEQYYALDPFSYEQYDALYPLGGKGAVTVAGTVSGAERVDIGTCQGNVTVAAGGKVVGVNDGAAVDIAAVGKVAQAGTVQTEGSAVIIASGDAVDLSGTTEAKTALSISGDTGVTGSGNVTAKGTEATLVVDSQSGDVTLDGEVTAASADFSADGKVAVANEDNSLALVKATGSSVELASKDGLSLGEVKATGENGTVSARTESGNLEVVAGAKVSAPASVMLHAGANENAQGTIEVNGTVEGADVLIGNGVQYVINKTESGTAEITSVLTGGKGGVVVNGSVKSTSRAYLSTGNGDIAVREGGSIKATDMDAEVDLITGRGTGGTGNIVVDGEISACNTEYYGSGAAYLYAGFGIQGAGAVSGDVTINGTVSADGYLDVRSFAGKAELGKDSLVQTYYGTVSVSAEKNVNANGVLRNKVRYDGEHVQLLSDQGNVVVGSDAQVQSYGTYGRIDIAAGDDDATKENPIVGNVEIYGQLTSKKYIDIYSGSGEGAQGTTTVGEGATVSADTAVEITAKTGADVSGTVTSGRQTWIATHNGDLNVRSTGVVKTTGDGGKTILVSGNTEGGTGDIVVSGKLLAEGTMRLDITETELNIVSPGAYIRGANGKGATGKVVVEKGGEVRADREYGKVEIANASGENSQGDVIIDGTVSSALRSYVTSAYGKNSKGNVVVNGDVSVSGENGTTGDNGYAIILTGHGEGASGDITINGNVTATADKGMVAVQAASGDGAKGNIHVNKNLTAGRDVNVVTYDGNIDINGQITAQTDESTAEIWALNGIKTHSEGSGNVAFGADGLVSSKAEADIVARGDVSQNGVSISVNDGFVSDVKHSAAVVSKAVNIKADGNVGTASRYFSVDGSVKGVAGGNMYLAAAGGKDFVGGAGNATVNVANIQAAKDGLYNVVTEKETSRATVDVAPIADEFNSVDVGSLVAGGSLGVFSSGVLRRDSLLVAGQNLTVSASAFGDVSYLQAGGSLSLNNVGKPRNPQVAYFQSVNGREPNINNQPNDTVIFIDGRLAGGNLKILNQFGANEAFMVSTPELKSTQGIFGNPTFLHSDLDVANPMEVSAIDYMLQETPRLTLGADFPAEVDSHVDSVVLPEKDSIQFGRDAKDAPATVDDKVALAK